MRSATRTGWLNGDGSSTTPCPQTDAFSLHGTGGEEYLGRGADGKFFEEVMLDGPSGLEAQLVGERDLLDGLMPYVGLAALIPRLGVGELVEQGKSHKRLAFLVRLLRGRRHGGKLLVPEAVG